jgi:hypothetical protein
VPLRQPRKCFRFAPIALATLWLLTPLLCFCQWQPSDVLCNAGNGSFDAEFVTKVAVHIAATRNDGLAARSCGANLHWDNQSLSVATAAAQVDLDVFGTDFGDGVPVAAFQIKQADSSCCMRYAIYSLRKPPRLLRTVAGGKFFSAADIDLDTSVEIFTDDAAAVQDFEKLTLGELDFPPPIVLRFTKSHLQDVSAEFQPYFDRLISDLRAEVTPHDLEEFKNSDGGLAKMKADTSAEDLHRLRTVKIKMLEIVWSYLYSGRESEAWQSLAEMWPARDLDRIRSALLALRSRGIRSQIDDTLPPSPRLKKRRAQIFNAINTSETGSPLEVTPPSAILLQRPQILQPQREQEVMLELVVDQAGKVRSATPAGPAKNLDADLIDAAKSWKFIPALKNGRAVASRFRLAVSGKQ